MASTQDEVSAQVIVRPAGGRRFDRATPITAANVADYMPDPDDAQRARSWFREQGFTVGETVANSFAITASPKHFEEVFGVTLKRDAQTANVVSNTDDPHELPIQRLPHAMAQRIESVTFSPPPDFGPTNFA